MQWVFIYGILWAVDKNAKKIWFDKTESKLWNQECTLNIVDHKTALTVPRSNFLN